MLKLNLEPVLSARGITTPFAYLVRIGFTSHSASVIINNPKAIKVSHIELLCLKLNCEPSDLFTWIPDKNNLISENHALRKVGGNVDALFDLTYKELKEMTLKVNASKKEAGM
jgi:DNA-binding Xre family transcriptional regulator